MSTLMFHEASGPLADLHNKLAGEQGRKTLDALKRFLRKENPWSDIVSAVNSLTDMIALGHYDRVNSDINEKNFGPETLVLGEGAKLFHFDRSISSEDAIVEMDKQGFKPATLGDLLDFGAKNPEEQRKYPIVALGSVVGVGVDRRVAYLDRYDSELGLSLRWFGSDWSGRYRFLAVRK